MTFHEEEKQFENIVKKRINRKLSIQEYLVDLLGGLFPGILFILAFMFSLFPPLFIIASYFDSSGITIFNFINSFLTSVQQTPSAIWIVTFLLFLLLAYVIGHIFYRQDPKIPDRNGFLRLRKIKKRKLVNEFLQQNKKYKIPFINHVFYILKRHFPPEL